MRKALGLIVSLAICFAVAGIGAWWTADALKLWYPALAKPSWTPPKWVFGPVWIALYAMMAIAAWRVAVKASIDGVGRVPLTLFAKQLGLNLAWSLIFFQLHRPGFAFVEILVLWVVIAATIASFARIDKLAALLMSPYLAWVTFASVLNYFIWSLNVG